MKNMSEWKNQEENVQFVAFGKEHGKPDSFIVKKGETLEGVIENIKPSDKGYKQIYTLRSKGIEPSLIILGNTSLNNHLGYGSNSVTPVLEGDEIRITYLGMKTTAKDRQMYNFKVEVKRS